jgi:Mg2+ and Co2+ transporter CorA
MRQEELRATITRAELYQSHLEMVRHNLESHRAVLYNEINNHESQSMKTIAVVTLVFLPATFVSAVFSTGIFNFHVNEGQQPRVISRYGSIYLGLCLGLTGLTFALWMVWYYWLRFVIEGLERKRHDKV